jgi:putative pectin methylesterase
MLFFTLYNFLFHPRPGSCTSEVMQALPYLKKAYGNSMQKILHVGPDSCTVVSNLLKERKVEAWGVEPYDLEDVDSTCKSLVRKGFVRMSDIKSPLPYRPDSFNLVVVSDALDYLTPRYLNKTLPDLARVSTNGLVIFAGMHFLLETFTILSSLDVIVLFWSLQITTRLIFLSSI